MSKRASLCAAIVALLAAGCSTLEGAPSPEAKAALAPTGTLRVAFLAVLWLFVIAAIGVVRTDLLGGPRATGA